MPTIFNKVLKDLISENIDTQVDVGGRKFKVLHNPSLRAEAQFFSETNQIQVGDKFFNLSADQKVSVLSHEIGHELSDRMLRDQSAFELQDEGAFQGTFKTEDGLRTVEGINGRYTPGENIAEAFSVLMYEPDFLKEHYPKAFDAISSRAKKEGMSSNRDELHKVVSGLHKSNSTSLWNHFADKVNFLFLFIK